MALWMFPVLYLAYLIYPKHKVLTLIALGLPVAVFLLFLIPEFIRSRTKTEKKNQQKP